MGATGHTRGCNGSHMIGWEQRVWRTGFGYGCVCGSSRGITLSDHFRQRWQDMKRALTQKDSLCVSVCLFYFSWSPAASVRRCPGSSVDLEPGASLILICLWRTLHTFTPRITGTISVRRDLPTNLLISSVVLLCFTPVLLLVVLISYLFFHASSEAPGWPCWLVGRPPTLKWLSSFRMHWY